MPIVRVSPIALWPAMALALASPGAAQQIACGDPAKFCGRMVTAQCLTKLGAGAIAADAPDCAEEMAAYRDCLALIAVACGDGGGAPGASAPSRAPLAAGEEVEPNDRASDATPIEIGRDVVGRQRRPDDLEDYFSFVAPSDASTTAKVTVRVVDFVGQGAAFWLEMDVRDAASERPVARATAINGKDLVAQIRVVPGNRYVLRVSIGKQHQWSQYLQYELNVSPF